MTLYTRRHKQRASYIHFALLMEVSFLYYLLFLKHMTLSDDAIRFDEF